MEALLTLEGEKDNKENIFIDKKQLMMLLPSVVEELSCSLAGKPNLEKTSEGNIQLSQPLM